MLIILAAACEPDPVTPDNVDNPPAGPYGTLIADFTIKHGWLPVERIIRTDLHIALNAYDMYRGSYIQSANLLDSQNMYTFYLAPGTYYLVAAIACICEGDSCSAAGFPGNKWGQKFASYTFTIKEDETTKVTIQFLK
jgi:hypothetical protein